MNRRVVILGAAGFIGQTLQRLLKQEGIPFLALGRANVDLTQPDADTKLLPLLKPTDSMVFLSTITPAKGRGTEAFVHNILMAETVCKTLSKITPAHLVYLSSDTIYPLHRGVISEESPTEPENLFGVMHLARESMLKISTTAPLACLRSTLVYGAGDPHNSYGPNRIRRMAHRDGKITLFGNGEECRDHIYVGDVATLILQTLLHQVTGPLNLSTGHSISYFDLAHQIAALFDSPIEIECTSRKTPITHRHFDVARVHQTFPSFRFTPLSEGLLAAHREECLQLART